MIAQATCLTGLGVLLFWEDTTGNEPQTIGWLMTPTQFVGQRPAFWKSQIQFSHICQIGTIKPLPVSQRQVFCEVNEQLFAPTGGEHVSRIICGNLGNNILTRAMRYADEMDDFARFSGYKSS